MNNVNDPKSRPTPAQKDQKALAGASRNSKSPEFLGIYHFLGSPVAVHGKNMLHRNN
jgi:hypothetical protein